MAGAPRLQEVQRLGAAHLADRDAVGSEAQRGADQIGERRDAILGAQGHEVGGAALQLPGVLDQHHPVGGLRNLGQQRVGECGLAGRGSACDQDVFLRSDRIDQRIGLPLVHDSGCDVVGERKHRDGGLADREARGRYDRRQQPLEPLAALGKLEELKGHLRGALNVGLTKEELIEVLMHTAVYCGVPAGVNALNAAAEVLKD